MVGGQAVGRGVFPPAEHFLDPTPRPGVCRGLPGLAWAPRGLVGPCLSWALSWRNQPRKGGFHSRLSVLLLNHLHSLNVVKGE